MQYRQFLTESKESRELMRRMNLKHLSHNMFIDNRGQHYKYEPQTKQMKPFEEKDFIKHNDKIDQIEKRKNNSIDIRKDIAEIKDIKEEFNWRLNALLKGKFSKIGEKVKELIKPASKGVRKGLPIFVPDAARQISQIDDEFVRYIVRSIYDNFKDITNGIVWRIHMNELFTGDFIMSIMRELNTKVQELTKKEKEINQKYRKEWSENLYDQQSLFELSNYDRRRLPQNVFNLPISKPFWDKYKEFKEKVKKEHSRVPEDKIYKYIENDYSYREEKRKIIKDFLETLPEYVETEKKIKEHHENEWKEKDMVRNAIKEELAKYDFEKIKPRLVNMIDQFKDIIGASIAKGNI